MESAEPAETAEQLAEQLEQVFTPIAPSLVIWAGGPDDAPELTQIPAGAEHLRYWVHRGAGRVASVQSIYSSQQKRFPLPKQENKLDLAAINKSLAAGSKQKKTKPPRSPVLTKSLGGGVCCHLPVMVYADSEGSLPRVKSEDARKRPAEKVRLSAASRPTRLAGVAICWGVMQHFYPYFDVVDSDWDAALKTALQQAAKDPDEMAYLHTLQTLVGKLRDGHGNVYNRRITSPRALPIALDWAGADPVVVGKLDSAPEQVTVGDVIVAINGESLAEIRAELTPRISTATDGWLRSILCHRLRVHADVDPCPVRLRKPGGEEYKTSMPLCSTYQPIEPSLSKPDDGAELAPGIVYFELNGADNDAFDEVFKKLRSAKGIVFDVRGYPGNAAMKLLVHLNNERTNSAQWNVPIVTLPDRENWQWQESAWDLPPDEEQIEAEIAFLTDGRAISYAESIMGIVEHYGMGEIVGSTTAGTNGNVNPFGLPGGYQVSWTGMKVLKHDGSQHHGVGIQPTVPVEPTPAGIAAGRDEVLEAAVKVIKKKLAS